ncbi:MAG: hypothetical protein AVW06_00675 [Hadesarchaea archaeon DG-33-1]|nr:MAG: hypothetical protein AVW06_00675 [Hadesarchaea archaeon DG-33-1]
MQGAMLIGFLPIGGKKEKEAFSLLKRNAGEVLDVVKKFEEMIIASFSERDIAKTEALGRKISDLETNADRSRRKFTSALHKGAFLPVFRGDLSRVAERLDDVADAAEETMRVILLREKLFTALANAEKKRKSTKVVGEGLVKMAGLTTKTVETLKSALDMMMSNVDAANEKANEVEKLEHELDIIEQGLINDLYEHEKLLDPISVMQLKEIIDGIGSISDRAEDASDVITIISYSFKI